MVNELLEKIQKLCKIYMDGKSTLRYQQDSNGHWIFSAHYYENPAFEIKSECKDFTKFLQIVCDNVLNRVKNKIQQKENDAKEQHSKSIKEVSNLKADLVKIVPEFFTTQG